MQRIPLRPSLRQSIRIDATNDFYGEMDEKEEKSARRIALWLMKKQKGLTLTENEEKIVKLITINLDDKVYKKQLAVSTK